MPVGKSDVDFAINIGKKIASLFNGKVSPNHWKGWNELDTKIGAPRGTNAINWVINDGDSIQSEALNIVSYMNASDDTGSKGILYMLGYSPWFKRDITVDDIARKLRKGGFIKEADDLLAEASVAISVNRPALKIPSADEILTYVKTNPLVSSQTVKATYQSEQPIKKASVFSNVITTILGIGVFVGILFGFKSRKKSYRRW